jgi:hypothetical protein
VQVDTIKRTFEAPGTKHLKLKCDILLSSFAFKFNLRRYTKATFAFDSRTNMFAMSAEIRYEDECVLIILQAASRALATRPLRVPFSYQQPAVLSQRPHLASSSE